MYSFRVEEVSDFVLLPTTCIGVWFNDVEKQEVLYGPCSAAMRIHAGKGRYFGIRFRPGAIPKWVLNTATPLSLHDKAYHMPAIADWQKEILEADTFDQQCDIFMKHLLTSLRFEIRQHKVISLTIDEITLKNGRMKLTDFYLNSGYSKQYINRVFKTEYGKSPKYFCKIKRFQKLIQIMLEQYPNHVKFTRIAQLSGYYDQSHMNKEFKEFTGISPERFMKIINNQVDPVSLPRIKEINVSDL